MAGKHGEPWEIDVVAGSRHIACSADIGELYEQDQGGDSHRRSVTRQRLARSIRCVNFTAGITLPEDGPTLADLVKFITRAKNAFGALAAMSEDVALAETNLGNTGKVAPLQLCAKTARADAATAAAIISQFKPVAEAVMHLSSCAVYNAPAYEPGPCDCGAEK